MMTAFLRNAGSCVPKLRVVALQVSVLSHYEFYGSRDVILCVSIFITSSNRALHLLPIAIIFNSINLKEGLKNIILPKKKLCLSQGCTNLEHQVARATKFSICGFSAWNWRLEF
jgi:hypothetical protein